MSPDAAAPPEILAIDFEPDPATSAWPTVAEVTPRVVVIRAGAAELDRVGARSRLAFARRADGSHVTSGDLSVLDDLDDGTRLFVDGWLDRPLEKPGRPGEGASWDAAGFTPPDRPPT